jgi:hypothetical protein
VHPDLRAGPVREAPCSALALQPEADQVRAPVQRDPLQLHGVGFLDPAVAAAVGGADAIGATTLLP